MQRVQDELNRLVEAGLPGAFAYVQDRDGSSQCLTAGWADPATRQPMTPQHHYRVGSTTKTFTAVVALQLVAEGSLGWRTRWPIAYPSWQSPTPTASPWSSCCGCAAACSTLRMTRACSATWTPTCARTASRRWCGWGSRPAAVR
jgi:Beta-lactamase